MEILRTQRLVLHTWTSSDIAAACTIWGDPKVMALLDKRGGLTETQVEERLSNEIARQESLGIQYWKVLEQRTGVIVGCCGVRPCIWGEPGFELGFQYIGTALFEPTGLYHPKYSLLNPSRS